MRKLPLLATMVLGCGVAAHAAALPPVQAGVYNGTLKCGAHYKDANLSGWSSPLALHVDGDTLVWVREGVDTRGGRSEFREFARVQVSDWTHIMIEAGGMFFGSGPRQGTWVTRGTIGLNGDRMEGELVQMDRVAAIVYRNCTVSVNVQLQAAPVVAPLAPARVAAPRPTAPPPKDEATAPAAPTPPVTLVRPPPEHGRAVAEMQPLTVEAPAALPAAPVTATEAAPVLQPTAPQPPQPAAAPPAVVMQLEPPLVVEGPSSFTPDRPLLERLANNRFAQVLAALLAASGLGWFWNAHLRNRCPSCRSTSYTTQSEELDRWRGTKKVYEKHSRGTNTRHVQTTYVQQAYHFTCNACSEEWTRTRREELGDGMWFTRLLKGY
jgi:hypothetical protein